MAGPFRVSSGSTLRPTTFTIGDGRQTYDGNDSVIVGVYKEGKGDIEFHVQGVSTPTRVVGASQPPRPRAPLSPNS